MALSSSSTSSTSHKGLRILQPPGGVCSDVFDLEKRPYVIAGLHHRKQRPVIVHPPPKTMVNRLRAKDLSSTRVELVLRPDLMCEENPVENGDVKSKSISVTSCSCRSMTNLKMRGRRSSSCRQNDSNAVRMLLNPDAPHYSKSISTFNFLVDKAEEQKQDCNIHACRELPHLCSINVWTLLNDDSCRNYPDAEAKSQCTSDTTSREKISRWFSSFKNLSSPRHCKGARAGEGSTKKTVVSARKIKKKRARWDRLLPAGDCDFNAVKQKARGFFRACDYASEI